MNELLFQENRPHIFHFFKYTHENKISERSIDILTVQSLDFRNL